MNVQFDQISLRNKRQNRFVKEFGSGGLLKIMCIETAFMLEALADIEADQTVILWSESAWYPVWGTVLRTKWRTE